MTLATFGQIQATINGIIFGGVDENGVEWHLTGLDGWGSPASTLAVQQKPRGNGAFRAVPAYMQPRTLAPSGTVYAPDFDTASDAWDQLCAAFPLTPTRLDVTEGSRTRYVMVQRQDETIPTWLTDSSFTFSSQLTAVDPRKFGDDEIAITKLPAVSGGFAFPLAFPFAINSTIVSGTCALINSGNTAGPVSMRIDGPCTGPIVTHVSSGSQLVFSSSLVLGSGEFLVIDMEAQTTLANGQSSRNGYIQSRGWSSFDPGLNTWAFTAAGYNSASKLTVTATPAWQ